MGVGLANIRKASEAQLRFIDRTRTDLAEILSADLKQVVTADTVNAKLVDWIELMNRRLPDDVWKIEKSREFLASPFRAQYRPGLDIIERNFRDGTSNRAHQSKTTEIADYNDLLFNDWAVHHFHLSDEYDGDFCKRTGPILFAYFYGDTVFFLDILEHGRRSPNVWADQHLVEVLDNNWPKITEKFHLKGALDLDRDISAPERIRLRNAGIAANRKKPSAKNEGPRCDLGHIA